MKTQLLVDESSRAPNIEGLSQQHRLNQLLPDIGYKRLFMVNVVFVGQPGGEWALVDAGLCGTAEMILSTAARLYGKDSRPSAIILTHGHFDHVGALTTLAEAWDCPVYAHPLERKYLDGSESYPPPDPKVGGGLMAALSPLYPRGPVEVRNRLRNLPDQGEALPGMPGWKWIHTPGHTEGHISLWREADKTLIAGDAFITTNQESAYSVATQHPEVHGPPMYFTPNWAAAKQSVQTLAALRPELVVAGHGRALRGVEMRNALRLLAEDFDRIAVPKSGRYVST